MSSASGMRRRAGFLTIAALAVACRAGDGRRAPSTALERAIYFVESSEDAHYGVSQATEATRRAVSGREAAEVEHVPWGHAVDVNGRLEIRVLKDQLAPHVRRNDTAGRRIEELRGRAGSTRELVAFVASHVELRRAALEAWQRLSTTPLELRDSSGARESFQSARNAYDAQWRELSGRIDELYPESEELRDRVEELVDEWLTTKDAGAFLAFLQGEIEAVEALARATVDEVEQASIRLRIEAFVVPRDGAGEPLAVHVPGYDRIDERATETIDRWGLALTGAERSSLAEGLAAVREIAEAAESVRVGQRSLEEAFSGMRTKQGAALGELAVELDALVGELRSEALRARVDATRAAADEFGARLLESLEAEGEAARAELDSTVAASLAAAAERLEASSAAFAALARIVGTARDLRDALSSRDPRAIELALALVEDAQTLARDERGLAAALEELATSVTAAVSTWAEGELRDVSDEVVELYGASALSGELRQWQRLARRLAGALTRLQGVAEAISGSAAFAPLPATIRAPDALDPPLEDAPDTSIDLTRTDRRGGDRLEVRASLVDGEATVATSSASFELAKLGWHADAVPAVVLLTADRLAGGDDSGGLSASLSWMLRYDPRRDEDGALAGSSRLLGWGVGLHAALLHFDPDNDAEVGLGGTLGLWRDLLLLGVGWNPLADAEDEGRVYYFVGSSLIPLLQRMQAE